jgi:hypothetical protein
VPLAGRRQQAVQHLFKLPLEQPQLGGLMLHCRKLSPDHR